MKVMDRVSPSGLQNSLLIRRSETFYGHEKWNYLKNLYRCSVHYGTKKYTRIIPILTRSSQTGHVILASECVFYGTSMVVGTNE